MFCQTTKRRKYQKVHNLEKIPSDSRYKKKGLPAVALFAQYALFVLSTASLLEEFTGLIQSSEDDTTTLTLLADLLKIATDVGDIIKEAIFPALLPGRREAQPFWEEELHGSARGEHDFDTTQCFKTH